jgi:hypothetical protein
VPKRVHRALMDRLSNKGKARYQDAKSRMESQLAAALSACVNSGNDPASCLRRLADSCKSGLCRNLTASMSLNLGSGHNFTE